jgi:biotin-dependent carboxylase-like uncharacterized protein
VTTRRSLQVVLAAGFVTVQDLGRKGFRSLGVPVSGALDRLSAVYANALVGNEPASPVIEVFGSLAVRFGGNAVVAVTGGYPRVFLDDVEVRPWNPIYCRQGSVLRVVPSGVGYAHYVAVAGGVACDRVLGSASTYVRGSMGCLGRTLKYGDVLEIGPADVADTWSRVSDLKPPQQLVELHSSVGRDVLTLRATEGIHSSLLRDIETLFRGEYTVAAESDRMGYRLEGEALESARGLGRLPSTPTDRGYVQVPPDGKPIVLMSDAQTTGGYAVALHIIPPDVDLLAQMSPGRRVRFKLVSVEEAEQEVRKYLDELEKPKLVREELEYWG